MRAAVQRGYGAPLEVIEMRERPVPGPPGPGQVLVRVGAAVVGAGDWRLTVADPWVIRLYQGMFRIKHDVLGHGLAGEVVAGGEGTERFPEGTRVFGEPSRGGGFAEYALVEAERCAVVPEGVADEVAAALPVAGMTALQSVRDHGQITAGARVLVIGAGGAVGRLSVGIARLLGGEVTGVDRASKEDFVREAGAAAYLDRERFDLAASGHFDVIVDTVGHAPVASAKAALSETGRYVAVSGPLTRTAYIGLAGGARLTGMVARPNAADLEQLRAWLADGSLVPAISDVVPLDQVAQALDRFGQGGLTGALVLQPSQSA